MPELCKSLISSVKYFLKLYIQLIFHEKLRISASTDSFLKLRVFQFLEIFSSCHYNGNLSFPLSSLTRKSAKYWKMALRITYKDTKSTFSELLQKDCAVTIHTKNLQILMTEMYKSKIELNSSFMQEIFRKMTTHYNL